MRRSSGASKQCIARLAVLLSNALVFTVLLQAQVRGESIRGSVCDTSGGVLPGVVVTLTDEESRLESETVTGSAGEYELGPAAPGSYTLRAMLPGFRVFEREHVTVGRTPIALDIAMEVAAAAETVIVEASRDAFEILPTRPIGSLFGMDSPIERTPRSISVIESDHIARYDMRTVNDLVTVAPGSFTGSYFGVPGSLFVRGEPGDNFFRGFRRVENRGNYATPVAASDHVEIVKGPPSPIYGGGKVGGFLNFVPKTARSASAIWMERPAGKFSITYGSYDQKIATAEMGVPLALGRRRIGLYAFVQAEDSHSFYDGIYDRNLLGQIAFDVELAQKWRLEFGVQGYSASRPQNIGWNRVTQELVDRKQYLSGTPLVNLSRNRYDLSASDLAGGLLQQVAFTRDMHRVFASDPAFAAQARLYQLDPATVRTVTLEHNQIFADAPDFSDSFTLTSYIDLIREIRPGLTFKTQTFYDRMDHAKYSTYGFGADYRPWVIENKTSLDFTFDRMGSLMVRNTAGASYRYSRVRAGESRGRGYQVIDRRDISIGATPNDRFQGPFNSNRTIPFNYYQAGSYGNAGAFLLSSLTYRERLDAVVGVRLDRYTPDFTGRFNGEPLVRSTSSDYAATYHLSIGYALANGFHPYLTYATSTYLELGQGSELDQSMVANGTYLQGSNLLEAGVKFGGSDKRVFATAALFRQKRTASNRETGKIDYFRTTGFEVEARAALSPRFSLTGAYTWQKPEQLNVPYLLAIPPALLGFRPEEGYGGRFVGTADMFGVEAPIRVAGQPPHVASLFGTYGVRTGFTLGTTYVSAVRAGYVSSVRLPSYMVWRGSVFHQRGAWTLNLAVNNLFNTEYYQSQHLFWDVFIKPSELRRLSLTVSRSF
jgi:iron complex outermembrane receptor protein